MSETQAAGSAAPEASAGNPAGQSQPAENGSAAGSKSWLDGLSEGNRKLAETKGWNTPESLDKAFTSYAELEKLQGSSLRVPGQDAPKEEWDKFHARLGRPEKPEAYEFKRPEGLPENVPYSDELATQAKGWFHEAGLPPRQAQSLHDKWIGYVASQQQAAIEAQGKAVTEAHDVLVKDWGPTDSEGFKARHQLANRAITQLGLVDSFKKGGILLPDGALTDATLAKALAQVGEAMFREDQLGNDGGASSAGNPFKKDAAGNRNLTAISALVKDDPVRARRLAQEAGENPANWRL